ncbi:ribokinase [Anaerococcus murdochii]|uniref:Ribokinase n=2 Tax=Anaerococcus TaxID=165779 RepID=A0ABS7SXQ3_9FIRM|nr:MULTISPECIES: ribokinase [Anaerococcus]MBP2015330.1 ribokinase [Anaerococcus degeneri]MBZ2386318.1 ribokinase [Anaerococcus murdochii]MCA2096226.1 ribokinase [Anaerococcus degeneri]
MKILNFGSINIDIFFRVEHIVRPGETISSESIEKRAGGKGLNQSVALAKVSDSVYHAGSIGTDGNFLIEEMENFGVDTSLLKKSDKLTGNAIIQVDDKGENSIVLYKGANFDNSESYVDEVLSHFEKDDILVLQNEINCMPYIVNKAYENGLKIVLNPSPITDEIEKIDLDKIDLLLVNETEAKALAKVSDAKKAVNYFRDNFPSLKVVETFGKNGSMYFDKDNLINQDSFKVDAVDTTGAGDTFTGYFVTYFYKGERIEKCLEVATKASALSVTKKGASISIPSHEAVLKFKG